jgi:hypothetical protein
MLFLLSIGFLMFSAGRYMQAKSAEAGFLGFHVINFHGCSHWIGYTNTTYSPGVISQSTMDFYFNQAFEAGGGWDSQCGDKLYRDPSFAIAQAYAGSSSWVQSYCGSGAAACAYPYQHVVGHEYYFWVFFRDTFIAGSPLYAINHEFGHVLAMSDITSCGYIGAMYQLPVGGGSGCGTPSNWPTLAELNENAVYITNPSSY